MSASDELQSETEEPKLDAGEAKEPAEPGVGELQPLDVYMVLQASISQFSSVAWQMLGLHPDPFTGKMQKDIDQARIAIDVTTVLVEKILPHAQGQESRDYQNLLTDLRLNFVRQSSQQQ